MLGVASFGVLVGTQRHEIPHAFHADEAEEEADLDPDHFVELPVEAGAGDDDVVEVHPHGPGVLGVRGVGFVSCLEAGDVFRIGRETLGLLLGETGVLRHLFRSNLADGDPDSWGPHDTVVFLDATPDHDVAAGVGGIKHLCERHDVPDQAVDASGVGEPVGDG